MYNHYEYSFPIADAIYKLFFKLLLGCVQSAVLINISNKDLVVYCCLLYRYHYYGITIKETSPYHDTLLNNGRQAAQR